MSYRTVWPALLGVLLVGATRQARAEVAAIWALDDGTKVKADALTHPLKSSNAVFDGKTIKLVGARNETVAFQVIIEGGKSNTGAVGVTLDRVGSIANSGTSNDPDTYFIGRNIEIFKELYLEVKERSWGLMWAYEGPSIPKDLTGPIPDPLVPLNLTSGTFEVSARRNQGVWVDTYIPRSTAPGIHKGKLVVSVDGQPCSLPACQLDVELTVVNATLPDDPPVKTMLWFSGNDSSVLGRYYDDPGSTSQQDKDRLRARHFKLARRHLVTLFLGKENSPSAATESRITGSAFSKASGYHGWGEGRGQDVYSIHTYGGRLDSEQANMWADWFKIKSPGIDYFLYVWDEPGSGSFGEINDIARSAKPVPGFVTARYTSELNEIDIFAATAQSFSPQNAQEGKAAGKRVWIYNGARPFSGTFATDDVAVSPRVNPWIQYKYGIERWFYWESTYYYDFQGGRGDINIFKEPKNFTNRWDEWANGDGLLFYPGTDRRFPEESVGFMGPLPSIRLKNWRRGIQDVAYLQLAKAAGYTQVHDAALNALVPSALSDKDWQQAVSWPENGDRWMEQRRTLALLFASDHTVVDPGDGDDAGGNNGSSGSGQAAAGDPVRRAGVSGPEGTLVGSCNVASDGQLGGPTWLLLPAFLLCLLWLLTTPTISSSSVSKAKSRRPRRRVR